MDRMCPNSKRAFGSGLGLANDVDLALGKEKVTNTMLHRFVADPVRRASVGAAFRGELALDSDLSFDQILDREIDAIHTICAWANLDYPGDETIEIVLQKALAKWGYITSNDRVIPAGLNLGIVFDALYSYNQWADDKASTHSINLYHGVNNEWWRKSPDIESCPTKLGVIRQSLIYAMAATDMLGSPYNLSFADQQTWAIEKGGDNIMSAEEVAYLFLRSAYEYGLPLWPSGCCRCRNIFESRDNIYIFWHSDNGFGLKHCSITGKDPNQGALSRQYVEYLP